MLKKAKFKKVFSIFFALYIFILSGNLFSEDEKEATQNVDNSINTSESTSTWGMYSFLSVIG